MAHYPYPVIGGGMAADAAVRGIRELDADRPIGLIGEEVDAPYATAFQGAADGEEPLDSVWRRTAERGADLVLGRRATALDPRARKVIDHDGREYTFERFLIATGGTPPDTCRSAATRRSTSALSPTSGASTPWPSRARASP
jgi:NADPH-dependent 2,4-dienoyl-CoA reductase/sulfur reductase-like enzyme